jgi:hypothetical protein
MSVLTGPKTHPFLQLLQWLRDPLEYMDRNGREFGAMFRVTLRVNLVLWSVVPRVYRKS